MCGGVTRDEWNVVAMTRGWNVKESRAVRLKVGLWRRKRPKWRRSAPSILKWIFRFHFKTTKPNKQSVVEPVGLRLLHVTDLFLYFSAFRPFQSFNSIEHPTAIPFPNWFLSSFQKRSVSLKIQRTSVKWTCLLRYYVVVMIMTGSKSTCTRGLFSTNDGNFDFIVKDWRFIQVFFFFNECFSLFSGLKASGYDGYRLTWNPCPPPPPPTKEEYQKVKKKKKKSASANYVNWQTKWSLTIG